MKITAAVVERAGAPFALQDVRPRLPPRGRGARGGRGGGYLPHRPDLPRPVVPGAASGGARARGGGDRPGGRQRRHGLRDRRPRRDELRLVRKLSHVREIPGVLLPRVLRVQLRGLARRRQFERAVARRPAAARALLRAVELRHPFRRAGAQHRAARRAIPLEVAAPFGCGVQTGAGSVLNVMRPPPGSSIAVFGAGAVGLSAVMAAKIAGCETIIGVDIRRSRLDFALEVGATHVVDASQVDVVEAIRELTGSGVDFSLEATGVPSVLRSAVDALTPTECVRRRRCAALRRRGEPRRQHDPRGRARDPRDRRGGERPVGVPAEARRALAARRSRWTA